MPAGSLGPWCPLTHPFLSLSAPPRDAAFRTGLLPLSSGTFETFALKLSMYIVLIPLLKKKMSQSWLPFCKDDTVFSIFRT